jgi:hypothetical protein
MNRKTFFLPLSTLSAIAIAIALAAAIAAGPAQPAYVPRAGNLDAVGDGNPIPTSRYQAALAAQAALTPAADKLPYYTGASTAGLADLTAFGRTLIDDANASTARSTLGLSAVAASGSASDLSAGTLAVGRGGTGLATYTVGDLIHASGTTTLANLADVSSGSVLVSGGVGAVPAWSASPTLTGGLTAGVTGQATPTRFNGLVGAVGGAGNGIVGVGHAPVSGYAMWVDAGTGNINGSAGNEIIAGQFSATNSPTSATSNATASFGVVTQGVWGGSANSSSDGLAYGGQLTGQVTGTASLKTVYGVEANALDLATGGTVVNANALWAHVTNAGSGNAITTARAVYAQIGGAGITDAIGVHIDLGSATSPTNVYGLKIDNVSNGATLNYAIYTGVAGLVHFGGAVDAPSVSTPTLYSTAGSISVGDGTSAIASLQVLGKTAQVEDLINLKIGGVSKFSVNNVGSVLFTGDLNFNANTAIFGANQSIRIVNASQTMASAVVLGWTSTTHAYDTKDTGIGRNAAGVVEVNNGTAGTLRDLVARSTRGAAVTVANLPATPVEGMMVAVTDSNVATWGTTIAGGGANHVLAYYDGTNWTVAAK